MGSVSRSVRVRVQGHLFKVRQSGRGVVGGGVRGCVRGFSRASRKRLLESFASLDDQVGCLFLSLTYPDPVPLPGQCKRDLDVFIKRLRRAYGESAGHWRFDIISSRERDYHPHFHLLIYNVEFIPIEWIQDAWAEVIGARGHCWIERIDSWRKGLGYMAKYVAKALEGRSLDYLSYLTADSWTGRMWGVFNRDGLPFAEVLEVALALGRWFYDVKRSGRKVFPGINDNRWAGFSLFVDDPLQWLGLCLFYGASA